MAGKKTKSFSLEPRVKEFADGLDNASKTVNDLLKSYKQSSGGRELAALELRLDHKKKELRRTEDKELELQQEIMDIENLIDEVGSDIPTIEDAQKALANTPLSEDNPAVENWATKLGMKPNELVEALETSPTLQ